MRRRRHGRALRRRYGRALPLIPIALAKLMAVEKIEHALETGGRWAVGGWHYVTGRKKRGKR
jgi:hypothetical protein